MQVSGTSEGYFWWCRIWVNPKYGTDSNLFVCSHDNQPTTCFLLNESLEVWTSGTQSVLSRVGARISRVQTESAKGQ